MTKCAESCNAKAYDFSKFADVHMNDLVDLCKFLNCSETNTLCKKYSLSIDPNLFVNMNKIQRTEMIRKLPEFTTKRKLLQNDLKVLFPLSGSTFLFKTRYNKTCIKFDINCSMRYCYTSTSKNQSKQGITRNCKTSKAMTNSNLCKFLICVSLDVINLDWFVILKGNCNHTHHTYKNIEAASIGKCQLTSTMINEINKLNKSCVSSSIQQNILLANNDVSVPIMTILNYQYSQRDQLSKRKTDFECLLEILRNRKDITYFVMYAKSKNTPLLTIKKTSAAKRAINNNVSLHGYVKVYQQPEESVMPPRFDSHQQKILKQLLTTNVTTNEVEVILAVGWARDSELSLFRKFPEVAKMDCTHSTNREERPLFNLVSKDTNNKLYTIMRCLLPSEKSAIFDSLLVSIIPKILGETTCDKLNVIITDGDSQEIKAAQKACKLVFKNATHINCYWHMIHNAINGSKVIYNPSLKHIIKHWLYFTATQTESVEEQKQSIMYLKVCLMFCAFKSLFQLLTFSY